MKTTKLPERSLDLLRAFALASVVLAHTLLFTLPPGSNVRPELALGEFAVLLFFVHTAFVLMGSLERQGRAPGWKRAFYLRRAFRVYPLTIVAVLAVLAIGDPAVGTPTIRGAALIRPPFDAATIASNLALVQNLAGRRSILGPMWMLPIELQMCLVFPLCFLAARRSTRAVVLVFVAFVAAYLVVAHVPFPGSSRLGGLLYAPVCMGGVIAYHLLLRAPRPAPLPWWSLAPMLGVAYMVTFFVMTVSHRPVIWVAPLAVAALIPFLREPPESRLTVVAHVICTYSYGIFLLHVPLLWLTVVKMTAYPLTLRVALAIVGIIALPWVAYHLIEKPGIDAGRTLSRRPRHDERQRDTVARP